MSIGVCIVAAGRRRHLARVLDGLGRQDRAADQVVVVVLDGEAVPSCGLDVDVVRRPQARTAPLAIGAARNAGATRLTTDRLVMLDVDCIPSADLVARYATVLDEHPDAIACGPVRYLEPGWEDTVGDALDPVRLWARSTAPAARPSPLPGEASLDGGHHDLFWSLSFGVTRPLWMRLGGFDERFVGYGAEDTDMAWRARDLGIALAWFGGGVAYHQWHLPARDDRSRIAELVDNAVRFHARWGEWPMAGWLTDLDRRGWVRFDPLDDVLVAT